MPFYTSKDALLQCKRASFRRQKGVDGETKGKEIYKNKRYTPKRNGLPKPKGGASPSPSEGGDVRGNGGIRKEGMCLAGYGMMCVGDIKGWRKRSYRVFIHSQKSKV
jgi:hypothetical protein